MVESLNFMGMSEENSRYEGSEIVVLPVPYGETTTWMKGVEKGPKAIVDASYQLEGYDIETDSEVYEKGIHTYKPITTKSPEKLFEKVHSVVTKLLKDKKFVVTLGGEHSVSIGTIKAYLDSFKDVSVLYLDAHADMKDFYKGSELNHACVAARVSKWAKPVLVGIRSMDASEKEFLKGYNVFYAHEIEKDPNWIKKVVSSLKKKVYVTLDLDVLDPSIMPSVGTPEPGGLGWYQIIDLLGSLTKSKKVVGFDVVELCPNPDNKAPDFLAAKLIYKFLSFIR